MGAGHDGDGALGREVELVRLGRIAYARALEWQRARAEGVADGRLPEALALLEHPPVYTLGARGEAGHLLDPPAALAARGASVVRTDRGGGATFHGPGQLVAWPILDLRARGLGAADYVRALEATLIAALARFGVRGEAVRGRPGVWAGGSKLAAIGVRVRRGVSRHGLALNVATDLGWFDAIVPCGLPDAGVASLERLTGGAPTLREAGDAVADAFARVFRSRLTGPAPALAGSAR